MKYVKMGDKKIPRIVIGTWSWGEGSVGGKDIFGQVIDETALKEVFISAIRNDFTMYDTAAVYADGDSERIIGHLSEYYDGKVEIEPGSKKEIHISTKFIPMPFYRKNAMAKSLEGSLERLKREDVDIFWIHIPLNYKKWVKELIPLLKEKKVKNVGVSNFNLKQVIEAEKILNEAGFELAGVQNHFSLIYQNCIDNGLLKWCLDNDVKFFSYMVMEQGALAGKYTKENPMPKNSRRGKVYNEKVLEKLEPLMDKIRELADKYDVKAAQIPIAWAINKGTLPIVGVTKQQHIYELGKVLDIELKQEEIDELEKIGKEAKVKSKGFWEQML